MDWEVVALLDIPEKIIEPLSISDLIVIIMYKVVTIIIIIIMSVSYTHLTLPTILLV